MIPLTGIGNELDYLACSGNNPYLYDAIGYFMSLVKLVSPTREVRRRLVVSTDKTNNETRNLSQNMASATYNLLNLPVDMSMVDGRSALTLCSSKNVQCSTTSKAAGSRRSRRMACSSEMVRSLL